MKPFPTISRHKWNSLLPTLALFLIMTNLSISCKTSHRSEESQVLQADSWAPDPAPEDLEVGMEVDVCPEGFTCKFKSKRTGRWIISALPANYFSKPFRIKAHPQTWGDDLKFRDTFLDSSAALVVAKADGTNRYTYRKLKNGTMLIMNNNKECLTNMGYKQQAKFTNCDRNNLSQQMTWNPDNDMAAPNGAFIWNQNVCLDIVGGGVVTVEGQTVIFYNCKDQPSHAGVNYNQRFKAIYD